MSGETMKVMMLLKGSMESLQGLVLEGEGSITTNAPAMSDN